MSVIEPKASTEQNDDHPQATVNTTSDGNTLGVVLFLGKSELEGLGITDADSIQYRIENGHLKLREVTVE